MNLDKLNSLIELFFYQADKQKMELFAKKEWHWMSQVAKHYRVPFSFARHNGLPGFNVTPWTKIPGFLYFLNIL